MNKSAFFTLCLLTTQTFAHKNFILISAPGSGKGTFSQYVVKKYGHIQISPGDILRTEIKLQTEIGKKIEPIVAKAEYIDEDIICSIMENNLSNVIKQNKSFILDGFPCSEISFQFLDKYLKTNNLTHKVCFLQFLVNDNICIDRIMKRLVCMNCFKVYNTAYMPPKDKNSCDSCGTQLTKRNSDAEEIVKKRLHHFHTQIEPLCNKAKESYEFLAIEAEHSINDLIKKYDSLLEADVK